MNREELFLSVINELRSRIAAADEYSLIKASALVRQLVLEERPLVSVANKSLGLKFSFRVAPFKDDDFQINRNATWLFRDIFPRGTSPAAPIWQTVNRDDFLRAKCLAYLPDRFSVREVVKFCAHVKGGVHHGEPKDRLDVLMNEIDENSRVQGIGLAVKSIQGIGDALLDGIKPLVDALEAQK
jgi:hypothetical protein